MVLNAAQIGGTPDLNWNDRYARILVGGEVLNRGFTVEGLTVTYMSAVSRDGNVDTVPAACEIFRVQVFLYRLLPHLPQQAVAQMFTKYVKHEEALRAELANHGDGPLTEWKRAFLLDKAYQPTRRTVLGLDIFHEDFAGKWLRLNAPHRNLEVARANLGLIDAFCRVVDDWRPDEGSPARTHDQIHKLAIMPALRVLGELLVPFRVADTSDSVEFTGLLLQLRTYLEEHPEASASVYQMSAGRIRRRSLNESDDIENLFQGRNPLTGPATYPGDQRIREENALSIQIHRLQLPGIDEAVPTLAIWLPKAMTLGVLIAYD